MEEGLSGRAKTRPSPEERRQVKRERREDPAYSDRRSRTFWALVLFAAFFAVTAAVDAYRCAHGFVVTEYEFETDKVSGPVNIVMVSDLHESEFGKDNADLVSKIRELEPDIILCVGDMITRTVSDDRLHIGLDFMAEMAKIAPTYMSLGNHEDIYVKRHGPGIIDTLKSSGVIILDQEYADVEAAGQTIRIGGIYGYCFRYGQKKEEYYASDKYRFFTELCDTDAYRILLCHRPVDYRLESEITLFEDWDIDLVLSGHTHGGLWQLPFIGSPYLPQQGFLPKLDKGLKDVGRANMIIGAGLGSENGLFRLNNPCELVVIRLLPNE